MIEISFQFMFLNLEVSNILRMSWQDNLAFLSLMVKPKSFVLMFFSFPIQFQIRTLHDPYLTDGEDSVFDRVSFELIKSLLQCTLSPCPATMDVIIQGHDGGWKRRAIEAQHRLHPLMDECQSCSRIDWTNFDGGITSIHDAVEHINAVMQSDSLTDAVYVGITFNMMRRFHRIRNEKDLRTAGRAAQVSHYPRWSAISPLIYGPNKAICRLEKFVLDTFTYSYCC